MFTSIINEVLLNITIILLLLTWQSLATAQNQSILLPFSGDTDPATGSKTLNFVNETNPVISTLPKHNFSFGTNNPHVEGDLHAPATIDPLNLYLFNEKYLGQHPMFAQQVVHDKDGNLLFFIVDNDIYNRYGES